MWQAWAIFAPQNQPGRAGFREIARALRTASRTQELEEAKKGPAECTVARSGAGQQRARERARQQPLPRPDLCRPQKIDDAIGAATSPTSTPRCLKYLKPDRLVDRVRGDLNNPLIGRSGAPPDRRRDQASIRADRRSGGAAARSASHCSTELEYSACRTWPALAVLTARRVWWKSRNPGPRAAHRSRRSVATVLPGRRRPPRGRRRDLPRQSGPATRPSRSGTGGSSAPGRRGRRRSSALREVLLAQLQAGVERMAAGVNEGLRSGTSGAAGR